MCIHSVCSGMAESSTYIYKWIHLQWDTKQTTNQIHIICNIFFLFFCIYVLYIFSFYSRSKFWLFFFLLKMCIFHARITSIWKFISQQQFDDSIEMTEEKKKWAKKIQLAVKVCDKKWKWNCLNASTVVAVRSIKIKTTTRLDVMNNYKKIIPMEKKTTTKRQNILAFWLRTHKYETWNTLLTTARW